MRPKLVIILMLFIGMVRIAFFVQKAHAQNGRTTPAAETDFMIRGYSSGGFNDIDGNSSFFLGSLNPLILWRQGSRLLFESEQEMTFEEEGFGIELEYADMSYILNDYMILRVGKFLTPLGTFGPNLHPAWINKFATKPLGLDHHDRVPMSEFGAELRGAIPISDSRINYSFYLSNGAALNINSEDPTEVPTASINFQSFEDNNDKPAFGSRIGIVPFGNSNLEIGFSGQFSTIGAKETSFDNVGMNVYAIDLNYVKHSVTALKGDIDLRSQLTFTDVDNFDVTAPDGDLVPINLDQNSYYVQLSYRPSMSQTKFLSNLELVGRYGATDVHPGPEEHHDTGTTATSKGEEHDHEELVDKQRLSLGINYWVSWNTLFKLSYQIDFIDKEDNIPGLYITYAIGL